MHIGKVSAGIMCVGRSEDMLIGREKELKVLAEAFQADESRFVAIYGRLRKSHCTA